jgi:hypothetical protein
LQLPVAPRVSGVAMYRLAVSVVVVMVLLVPAAVHAQMSDPQFPPAALAAQQGTVRQPPSRIPPDRRTVARAYFLLDSTAMTAADTFDAVIGTPRLVFKGGGAEALNLSRELRCRPSRRLAPVSWWPTMR